MILYIHGFKSCAKSNKSEILRRRFKEVVSPDLPPSPKEAFRLLCETVEEREPKLIVGSSLGGYYAVALSQRYSIRSVLINPSLKPYITLLPFVGENRRYCDGEPFEWSEEHIKELIELKCEKIDRENYLVLLQSGDELLDYRESLNLFWGGKVVVEYGGNHRFENLCEYLDMIENFLKGGDGCD